MDDWRNCENCGDRKCSEWMQKMTIGTLVKCEKWKPFRCRCGGALSITRYHNGRPYRHCYSCHMEFYEDVK